MNKLQSIFHKKNKILIGAIHFPPLLGYAEFPGFKMIIENALADLKAFEDGGFDAIIFENNYDVPHEIFVKTETIVAMTYLGEIIKKHTQLPVGISVLWNDYKTALSIAKVLDLQFIRIPVFIDKVETSYGIVDPCAKEVIAYRKKIKAEEIAIFTDIHVKHSKLLSKYSLRESAKLAVKNGSDGIIITGDWTGQCPDLEDLQSVKNTVINFPILAGSGADVSNVNQVFQFADVIIVSSSLKRGSRKPEEVNTTSWKQRIDLAKVKKMVNILNINKPN